MLQLRASDFPYAMRADEDEHKGPGQGRAHASPDERASRRLELIATGWIPVEGATLLELDLAHNLDRGFISLAGGFLGGNHDLAEFECFYVYTP